MFTETPILKPLAPPTDNQWPTTGSPQKTKAGHTGKAFFRFARLVLPQLGVEILASESLVTPFDWLRSLRAD
jgi:hypothetical protein